MTEIIIFLALIFLFVVAPLVHWSQKKKMAETDRQVAAIPNFHAAIRFDDYVSLTSLRMDPVSKQFAITSEGETVRAYSFDQVVTIEVEKDGSSVHQTNRGSQAMGAAAGGLLLGPAGLLLGGLSGPKRTKSRVHRLALKIYTNDFTRPVEEVVFLNHKKGLKPADERVTKAGKELEEWYGRFRTILKTQSAGEPAPEIQTRRALPSVG